MLNITPEQTNILLTNERMLRSAIGSFARALRELNIVNNHWQACAQGVAEIVPDKKEKFDSLSNLNGIETLTVYDINMLYEMIQQILETYYTPAEEQLYSKVAGPENI